jgi:hypothetical protein
MRTLLQAACIAMLVSAAIAQSPQNLVAIKSAPDVTGTGVAVKVFPASAGPARSFLIIADPANSAAVRCGDSLVSSTQGSKIAAGAGWGWGSPGVDSRQPVQNYFFDISTVYCFIASGDKVSLSYAQ